MNVKIVRYIPELNSDVTVEFEKTPESESNVKRIAKLTTQMVRDLINQAKKSDSRDAGE